MNGNPWTPREIEKLQDLAGDLPFPVLCREYNNWAKGNDLPTRTNCAIRTICNRHGAFTAAYGEWLTCRAAAQMLGGNASLISHWVRRGWIPSRRFSPAKNAAIYISRSDLRTLARKRPELFTAYRESNLIVTLCSETLARAITNRPINRRGRAMPVIQLSTGRRFPSVAAAARAMGVGKNYLQAAVHNNWRCAGSYWKPLTTRIAA